MSKSNVCLLDIKKILLIILAMFVCNVYATNIPTQGQMNEESCKAYKNAEKEMEQTYQQVLTEYHTDKVFIQKLRIAQKAWVSFRNAHVESMYPNPNHSEYGSVHPLCRCNALTEITQNRIKELSQWTIGIEEGDVCAGSRKSKE